MGPRLGSRKPLVAVWDGIRCPLTYDFVVFAGVAKSVAGDRPLHFLFVPGPNGEISKPGKFPDDEQEYRFRHIVLEAAPLFGASFTVCPDREFARPFLTGDVFPKGYTLDAPVFDYHTDLPVRLIKAGGKPTAPRPSAKALKYVKSYLGERKPLTVTLRHSRNPARNSGDGWVQFADESGLDVVFVPDTDQAFRNWPDFVFPQAAANMDIRLALYHLSALNCFTSNGCCALLHFSDVPYLSFKAGGDLTEKHWSELMIPYGTQPNFAASNQRWIWGPDTIENIRKEVADGIAR